MNRIRKTYIWAVAFLLAFVAWTLLLRCIDVQPIGPRGSAIGFASINRAVHKCFGVHMVLYTITDWLGLVPFFVAIGFGAFGLAQWIQRKHILKVDYSLLVLGVFYIATMTAYLLFEEAVINYRPVLINGHLEASYPSSTTILVLCVMPSAAMQLKQRIRNKAIKMSIVFIITIFTVFMVLGRLLSGVHWMSDIVGGVLLSAGLLLLYHAFCEFFKMRSSDDRKDSKSNY